MESDEYDEKSAITQTSYFNHKNNEWILIIGKKFKCRIILIIVGCERIITFMVRVTRNLLVNDKKTHPVVLILNRIFFKHVGRGGWFFYFVIITL